MTSKHLSVRDRLVVLITTRIVTSPFISQQTRAMLRSRRWSITESSEAPAMTTSPECLWKCLQIIEPSKQHLLRAPTLCLLVEVFLLKWEDKGEFPVLSIELTHLWRLVYGGRLRPNSRINEWYAKHMNLSVVSSRRVNWSPSMPSGIQKPHGPSNQSPTLCGL